MVRKVVKPAKSSVRTVVPFSASLNQRSSKEAFGLLMVLLRRVKKTGRIIAGFVGGRGEVLGLIFDAVGAG